MSLSVFIPKLSILKDRKIDRNFDLMGLHNTTMDDLFLPVIFGHKYLEYSFQVYCLHLFMIVRTKIIGHYSLFVIITPYSLLGIQTPLVNVFALNNCALKAYETTAKWPTWKATRMGLYVLSAVSFLLQLKNSWMLDSLYQTDLGPVV